MSYHFQHVSKSEKFHTHSDDRAFDCGGPKPMPFVSVDGRKAIQFSFLISTELIPPRHRPSTLSRYVSRVAFWAHGHRSRRETSPRLHSSSDNDVTWRHRLPSSPPATLFCIGRSSIKFRVPLTDLRVVTNETVWCYAQPDQLLAKTKRRMKKRSEAIITILEHTTLCKTQASKMRL